MLPKIDHPIIYITIPSTKKEVKFRPYLVKEEKILLMAKTGNDERDIFTAINQVINNSCLDPNFDIQKHPTFDMEYIFLKLRENSVSDIVTLTVRDSLDDNEYKLDISLKDVSVVYPEGHENKIQLDDKIGLVLKYPLAGLYSDRKFLEDDHDAHVKIIAKSIDYLYDEEAIYKSEDYKFEELVEYVNTIPVPAFNKIADFLTNQPYLYLKLKYITKDRQERFIELKGLTSFFTLR